MPVAYLKGRKKMTFFDLLNTASNGLEAQRQRMEIVSQNIANASTPGYKKQIPVFSQKTANPFSIIMARQLGIKEEDIVSFLSGNHWIYQEPHYPVNCSEEELQGESILADSRIIPIPLLLGPTRTASGEIRQQYRQHCWLR